MKKILTLVFGLMSLITMSSCNDKIDFDDSGEFLPIGYIAKAGDSDNFLEEHSTLQIMGIRQLIFDEIEKTDWKIISPSLVSFKGYNPLTFEKTAVPINNIHKILEVQTNYESIPIAFGNTQVLYQYINQNIELQPIGQFSLYVTVEENRVEKTEDFFYQDGNIVFALCVSGVPVKVHRIPFLVYNSTDIN